jgi:hypothetical protein
MITVWDQRGGTGPRQIGFPHGALSDLQFSPDKHLLAIAGRDLGLYLIAAFADLPEVVPR